MLDRLFDIFKNFFVILHKFFFSGDHYAILSHSKVMLKKKRLRVLDRGLTSLYLGFLLTGVVPCLTVVFLWLSENWTPPFTVNCGHSRLED